jgi:cold shock CspA family protein
MRRIFGFIQPDEGGQDVFVSIAAVERAGMNDLREGEKLSFELEDDRKRRPLRDAGPRTGRLRGRADAALARPWRTFPSWGSKSDGDQLLFARWYSRTGRKQTISCE